MEKAVPAGGSVCQYKFQRGQKKDLLCGEPTDGGPYCKSCIKKKSVGGTGTGAAAAPTNQGFTGVAPNQGQTPEQTEQAELAVITIVGRPGEYKSVKHGFVIQNHNGGRLVTRGVAVEGKPDRPLTDEEKVIAMGLGIHVLEVDEKGNQMPTFPPVIANPGVQIPMMPM